MSVRGVATHTIAAGKLVWSEGKLDAVKGAGRYVDRPAFAPYFEATRRQAEAKQPRAVVRQAAE
jgi:dihydropyrimidinase